MPRGGATLAALLAAVLSLQPAVHAQRGGGGGGGRGSGAGSVGCQSCAQLGWSAESGDPGVCAESDDGFACTSEVDFDAGMATCTAVGARLCTATELLLGEGQGTGCGHDAGMIWSSSRMAVLQGQHCSARQRVVVSGDGRTGPTCMPESSPAAVRCCADSTCIGPLRCDSPSLINQVRAGCACEPGVPCGPEGPYTCTASCAKAIMPFYSDCADHMANLNASPEVRAELTHVHTSRRRDCHFADSPSPSILERLLKGEMGATE